MHEYKSRKLEAGCSFCKAETIDRAIFENELIYVAPNLTKYDLWESHDVSNHLLVIPKRHVELLAEMTEKEKLAVIEFAAKYEAEGYSIYARGKNFINRSVKHQHTHLIKVTNKRPRILLFLRKPYYLLKR
jgi:diadenosine tetraphosphate (Ap4A) HIT family hydrolase